MADAFAKHILGYCDPLSVKPGDAIRLFVSCDTAGAYRADLVRLICGDARAQGAGFQEELLDWPQAGSYPGRRQPLVRGSYVELGPLPREPRLSITLRLWPTRFGGERCLLDLGGVRLVLDEEGRPAVVDDAGARVTLTRALRLRQWYRLSAGLDFEADRVALAAHPLVTTLAGAALASEAVELPAALQAYGGPARIAAPVDRTRGASFDGKLEAVSVYRELPVDGDEAALARIARWDFAREIESERVVDVSGNGRHGTTVNLPARAVKGSVWDGSVQDWQADPAHYAAIHFHSSDLGDAGWEPDLEWRVPAELASGVYAFRLRHDGTDDYVPFFLCAAAGHERPVAFLASTATYLAYANQRLFLSGGIFGDPTPRDANTAYLKDHPEVGYSTYERHDDGSGVQFSSRLRPILNLKPKGEMWSFNADTNVVAWLEHAGADFDVITDEELHRSGVAALAPYRVVLTGTHPEYYSTRMLDGLEGYLRDGGRLMYLGGNGFYWRIAYRDDRCEAIEVRRAEDGTRAWIAEPGEYYHAWGGEYGGLWRRLGRPPNQLVGVGFAAQGFDRSAPYRWADGAQDARVAFAVDGLDTEGLLGDFGSIGGGAAGEEIDRCDGRLGSPAHALVLASADQHAPSMLRTKEEFLSTLPAFEDKNVRADIVFFETAAGGACFSVGSIAYAGALAHDGYDNDVARLTANVLARFTDPAPFALPADAGA